MHTVQVVKKFLRRDTAEPFSEPVPADYPGYLDCIERPMDLGTVLANLQDEQYASLGMIQFEQHTIGRVINRNL